MYLGTIPVELDSFLIIFGSLNDRIIEMISSNEKEKQFLKISACILCVLPTLPNFHHGVDDEV